MQLGDLFLEEKVKIINTEAQALCAGISPALRGAPVFERGEVRQPAHPLVLELCSTAGGSIVSKC